MPYIGEIEALSMRSRKVTSRKSSTEELLNLEINKSKSLLREKNSPKRQHSKTDCNNSVGGKVPSEI